MPIAQNDKGETVFLDASGNWSPAKMATNPQTGESLAFDGKGWVHVQSKTKYGFTDALMHGVTMGAGQEVGALGAATGDAIAAGLTGGWDKFNFGKSYQDALNKDETARKAFLSNNPVLGTATEIAGGVASGGPALAKTVGMKALEKVPATIKGLVGGGLIGAGAGALENNKDRTAGAISGGILGGGLGMSAPIITSLAAKYGQPVVDAVMRRWGNGPRSAALRRLMKDLDDDAITLDQFKVKLHDLGDDAVFADAGGQAVATRADAAVQMSGAARQKASQTLVPRQRIQHERIIDMTNKYMGTEGNYHTKITDLMKGKSERAGDAYKAAYQMPAERLNTPEVQGLLQNPAIQDAMEDAAKLAAIKGKKLSIPDMESLDFVKRALDDRVSRAYRTGDTQMATALRDLRNQYRDALDAANPSYAKAREIYAGDSAVEEAMEAGRAFFRGDADEVVAGFAKMKPTEQQAFREGVSREMRRAVESKKVGANKIPDFLDVPDKLNRLKAVFPNEQLFKQWENRMKMLGVKAETNRVLGGSPTAKRTAAMDELGFDPAPLTDAAKGDFGSAALGAGRNIMRRMQNPQPVADELGRVYFESDPVVKRLLLKQLEDRARVNIQGGNTLQGGLLGASGLAGGLLGPRL